MSQPPIAFFCGHRKSGTTLLVNLFDGHPELSVYPHDIKVLYAYYPRFVLENVDPKARWQRIERLLYLDLKHKLVEKELLDAVDVEAFWTRVKGRLADEDLADMGTILRSIADALPTAGERTRATVLKETSVELYADELFEWCPGAKVVQLIRDPRDNYAALKAGVERHYEKLGEGNRETLMSLLFRCSLGFRAALANRSRFGSERYLVIRFEDLVAEPESTLTRVTDFLGIAFHDCLRSPTVFGRRTSGNNYEGREMRGISGVNIGRWRERIGEVEAQVIEHCFGELLDAFGYQATSTADEQARAVADFYRWANYRYFFSDPYSSQAPLPKQASKLRPKSSREES